MNSRRLKVVYILSSTYDDEGYVLRYWRGILPSNTLAVMQSLTRGVADSGELGEGVEVSVEIFDDTVQRIPVKRIVQDCRREGTQLVVGFVGVQTNHFERASDLALEFRAQGAQVMMGGFHVSGVLTMFDRPTRELQRLLDHGVTLVKGEAEAQGVLAGILRDALEGTMKPLYDIQELPDLATAPVPMPDADYLQHFKARRMATVDTSRGCPYNCSFCTIINVQGRKMRSRSAQAILNAIETNHARGIDFWFFTDDNFGRSPIWEELLDGLIVLRERGIAISFMMQVDTRAHLMPNFIEKASRAGCYMAFIGMESVNPKNLEALGKVQNDTSEYPAMVETWHRASILVHVGYIIGLAHDTRESIRQDVIALMNEVKVDEASFFMLTPIPGSRDHKRMIEEGVPLDADLNNFDSLHETYRHPLMPPGEWALAHTEAWETFYDQENIVNVMLRTPHERYWQMLWTFMWYRYSTLKQSHPMFTGLIRLKDRKARRPIFPREKVFRYAWRRAKDLSWEARTFARLFFEFQEVWMLTCKREDPRWATLAELRGRWAQVQTRLMQVSLTGRRDLAAQEIRDMLAAASERLHHLGERSKAARGAMGRRLRWKAQEAEDYLHSFEKQLPTWQQIVAAEEYVKHGLLAGYEELAIRYVAKRRQFNAYRRDVVKRLKTGRVLTLNVSAIPQAFLFELVLGIRFLFTFLRHA